MATAFQPNAFQNNAFQITVVTVVTPVPIDLTQLDKGLIFQALQVYLGPTLGWRDTVVNPAKNVSGSYVVGPGDDIILVNSAIPCTISLPDIVAWMKEPHYQPYNSIERCIWIKDIGGQAAANNITINPFGTQKIDLLTSYVIISNHANARLYPMNDLSGWYVG